MLYKVKFKTKPPAGWTRHTVWNVKDERDGLCLIGKTWIPKRDLIVYEEAAVIGKKFKRRLSSLAHDEVLVIHDKSLMPYIAKQAAQEGLLMPDGSKLTYGKYTNAAADSVYIRVNKGIIALSSFAKSDERLITEPEKFIDLPQNAVTNDDSERPIKQLVRMALSGSFSKRKSDLMLRTIADPDCDNSHYKLLIEALKTV